MRHEPEQYRWLPRWARMLLSYVMGSYLLALVMMLLIDTGVVGNWLAVAPISLPVMAFRGLQGTIQQDDPIHVLFVLNYLLVWALAISVTWWVIEMIHRGRWLFWPWLFLASMALALSWIGSMMLAGH